MVTTATGLKRTIWVAPSTVVNGVRQYGTPVEYRLNCRGITSAADIMGFGPSYVDYRRVVAPNAEIENIHELDRAWIDETPADATDVFASDAGFYVQSKMPGLRVGQVMFKRLSADA